jgi:hypothetical protein
MGARSSTGQSIGLRIRPSPVTQRDIASSHKTANPSARRGLRLSPILQSLSGSLAIYSFLVKKSQLLPNHFGLGEAEGFLRSDLSRIAVPKAKKKSSAMPNSFLTPAVATEHRISE